jgi:imidazolonepropionase-like amidohydrolase
MKSLNLIKVMLALLVLSSVTIASTEKPAPPQRNMIALINCTVHPVTSEPIENASIIFDKGKIVDIIRGMGIPANAISIDLGGKHVYPAMIETFSELGITEIESVTVSTDTTEGGEFNPNAYVKVAVNPESEQFPVARSNGIGMAVTVPSGGIISGQAALLKMDGWTWEEMCVKSPVGMVVNWPGMPADANAGGRGGRGGRGGAGGGADGMSRLDKVFEDARAYFKAKEAAAKTGRLVKINLRWEAMKDCIDGKEPLLVRADNLLAIQSAVGWAQRQKVKIIIVGGTEAVYCTNLLKEKNVPVIIMGTLRLPRGRDMDFDEPFTLPAKLQKAGVKFCIAAGGASNVRNLPFHAAKAAAYGLPKDEALKSVTLYPAQIIGADFAGCLEKGKDATLMITNGDPLEATTTVEQLYIQGRKIDMSDKQKNLYQKYQERYQQG